MASPTILNKKKQVVDDLKEKIEKASILVLTESKKVSVKEISELRQKLFKLDSEFKVVKNTLLKKALAAAGLAGLSSNLTGSVAVLFGYKDPVAPIKTLVEFADEYEKTTITSGMMDKNPLGQKEIVAISKLPPREALIAKMVGGFNAPIYRFVNALAGNLRKLVYALNAVKEKKSSFAPTGASEDVGLPSEVAGGTSEIATKEGGEK